MEIHVYFHTEPDSRVTGRLDRILTRLDAIAALEQTMSTEMDTLQTQVTNTDTAIDSAIVLLNGLSAQIAATAGDPAKAAALAADLKTKTDALAAAIVANTPAAAPATPTM
jgi:exosortase/archaeosortase